MEISFNAWINKQQVVACEANLVSRSTNGKVTFHFNRLNCRILQWLILFYTNSMVVLLQLLLLLLFTFTDLFCNISLSVMWHNCMCPFYHGWWLVLCCWWKWSYSLSNCQEKIICSYETIIFICFFQLFYDLSERIHQDKLSQLTCISHSWVLRRIYQGE